MGAAEAGSTSRMGEDSCNVCGRSDDFVGYAAVPGAPVTIGWCKECLQRVCQPMFVIETALVDPEDESLEDGVKRQWREQAIDPREHLAEWFLESETYVDGEYVKVGDLLGRYVDEVIDD